MAITSAALQAELGTNPNSPTVRMQLAPYTGTNQHWLVSGGVSYPGRVKLVATTAGDDAATQAAAVLASLLAGPA